MNLQRLFPRYPILLALLAQALAVLAVVILIQLFALAAMRPPVWSLLLGQGLFAAGLGRRFGLSPWWLPINLLFVPGLFVVQGWQLPAWLFLGAFVLVLLSNWNSWRGQVPLYLSSRRSCVQLRRLLEERPPDFNFIDLGCGLGSVLCSLAQAFPQARFTGVENAPLPFLLAWLRSLRLANCSVRYRSLWLTRLEDYQVVYCFLSPAPMTALWQKTCGEMGPGSWLVSNSFAITGVEPQRILPIGDWRGSALLVWHMEALRGAAKPG